MSSRFRSLVPSLVRSKARRADRPACRGVEALEPRTLMAAALIQDINQVDSSPANLTQDGALVYFTVGNSTGGEDMYKTDGTAAGSVLVKSFPKGANDSGYVSNLTPAGAILYFDADTASGTELWKTDGTAAGTVQVVDLAPGTATDGTPNSSFPSNLTLIGSTLYFSADDGKTGTELWKTDGTAAGTVQVVDLLAGSGSSSPSGLTVVGTTLYFAASTSTGSNLYKSDGTAAGTVPITFPGVTGTVNVYAYGSVIASLGSDIYFSANIPSGIKLFKSDTSGTMATQVSDTAAGSPSSFTNPSNLITSGSFVYFTATGAASPPQTTQLWRTDGTTAGTVMLFSAAEGTSSQGGNSAFLSHPTPFGKGLLFEFTPQDSTATQLMTTDGTTAGTSVVKDITPFSGSGYGSYGANIIPLGGLAYFAENDPSIGTELFRTDGTAAGTVAAADLNPGAAGSDPTDLTAVGNKLYFAAHEAAGSSQLLKSDGTAAGTTVLLNVSPPRTASSVAYYGDAYAILGTSVVFAANDGVNGVELWKTDGTAAGTALVKDVAPSSSGGGSAFTIMEGSLYFAGAVAGNTASYGLWKTDGTAAGTSLVHAFSGLDSGSVRSLTVYNGAIYFAADDSKAGSELWKSDGTTAGTALVDDINPGTSGSSPSDLTVFGTSLYFAADDGVNGDELWKTDGTAAGTSLVKDVHAGASDSSPANLTVFHNSLYFTADDGVNGNELWNTVGTAASTFLVDDIHPGASGSYPSDLTVAAGHLFFAADDGTTGDELWQTDGTTTAEVKNINTTAATTAGGEEVGGNPSNFVALGSILLFTASDGKTGDELYRSDGTAFGTVEVKDINPGSADGIAGTYNYLSKPISGLVYFGATDGTTGNELWQTDGTAAGTVQTADINPGAGDSNPILLGSLPTGLVVAANDGFHGSEPVLITSNAAVTNHAPTVNPVAAQSVTVGSADTFTASATDPDTGQAVTFSLGAGAPSGATINPKTGAFSFTPAAAGTYTISIVATDNGSPPLTGSTTVSIVATTPPPPINHAPTLSVNVPTPSVTVGTPITFTASATDPDAGQVLTFSLGASAPPGATIDAKTGVVSFTPVAVGTGTYTFPVIVTDNGSPPLSATTTVSIGVVPVPRGPSLSPISPQTVVLGQTLTLQAVASDPNFGQQALYSLASGAPAGASINPTTGVLTYSPTAAGTYTFAVIATDGGNGLTSAQAVVVTVQPALVTFTSLSLVTKRGALTGLTLNAAGPLSSSSTPGLGSFSLVQIVTTGKGKRQKTVQKGISLGSLSYSASSGTITLAVKRKFALAGNYQLQVNASGVLDSFGRAVDGDRNGQPGGQATFNITKRGATAAAAARGATVSAKAIDALLSHGMRAAKAGHPG